MCCAFRVLIFLDIPANLLIFFSFPSSPWLLTLASSVMAPKQFLIFDNYVGKIDDLMKTLDKTTSLQRASVLVGIERKWPGNSFGAEWNGELRQTPTGEGSQVPVQGHAW